MRISGLARFFETLTIFEILKIFEKVRLLHKVIKIDKVSGQAGDSPVLLRHNVATKTSLKLIFDAFKQARLDLSNAYKKSFELVLVEENEPPTFYYQMIPECIVTVHFL